MPKIERWIIDKYMGKRLSLNLNGVELGKDALKTRFDN